MSDEVWTVRRVLEWIEGYLAQHGDGAPRASSQWLVSEALGVSRMQLFLDAERPLTSEERSVLRDWTRRRGAGEPLQYITGNVAFRHINVKIRRGVLIPRPETEVLVSEALALLPPAPKPQDAQDLELIRQFARQGWAPFGMSPSEGPEGGAVAGDDAPGGQDALPAGPRQLLVADMCTGSGCIACAIAHEHANARVLAVDIAPEAVALARDNVDELGLGERIRVVEGDLGDAVDSALLGTFDLVVSNPPYVPSAVLASLPDEVSLHEPMLALDGGADGLDVFRRLLDWCAVALKPGGAFAFELHETCLDDAAAEADYAGFSDVRIVRDLADRPRVLTARKRA